MAAGLGIRTGISEVANNHLSDVPAYGARMAADLVRAKDMGAKGLKISKGLGLGIDALWRGLLAGSTKG